VRTVYERPSKNEKEANFFDSFLALAADLPTGTWTKSEAPDYILLTDQRRIGLEITSLVNSSLAPIRNAQDKALESAQKLATERSLPFMEVRAKFRDDDAVVDPADAAGELVDIVTNNLGQIDDTKLKVLNGFSGKYFSTIMVSLGTRNGRRWLDAHRWHRAPMGFVSQDPVHRLQAVINEKDSKLDQYLTACQECWLLVGVNEWTAPEAVYFSEQGLTYQYSGRFSRIYFLRNIEGKLWRLVVSRPTGRMPT